MNRREIFLALFLSLMIGGGLVFVLLGSSEISLDRDSVLNQMMARPTYDWTRLTPTVTPELEIVETGIGGPTPEATPTVFPLVEAPQRGSDVEDVLLLYSSSQPRTFDTNFCKIAEYYGLLCKQVDVSEAELTEDDFKNSNGEFLHLIGVSAQNLLVEPYLLSSDERAILLSLIESEGLHLLLSDFEAIPFSEVLADMTEGSILGAYMPVDTRKEWFISDEAPEITRELTNREFRPDQREPQNDLALYITDSRAISTLISSTAYDEFPYPIFVRWGLGSGSIFVSGGEIAESLEDVQLVKLFYDYSNFSKIIPTMMTFRYVMGQEAWHRETNFANLCIDGVLLRKYAYGFDFEDLAEEMKMHRFHTSILAVPANLDESELEIINLIRSNPEHYSLIQQGNNHDGYEFYRYVESEDVDEDLYPIRPIADQEEDIIEGLSRLLNFSERTTIETDRIMVFPLGISPEETLLLLKKYNYLASVNRQSVPLDRERPTNWDYGMYPASIDFGNFPILDFQHPGSYRPFESRLQTFLLDLFIGKPALFYSSIDQLFEPGIDTFNIVADELNSVNIDAQWASLDYILTHLYLEKENDDASLDLRFYTNHVVINNTFALDRIYHISKDENENVPIAKVKVNGQDFPYRVINEVLMIDIEIPAGATIDVRITYLQ